METVAAKLPRALVEGVDGVVAAGAFPNRSEVLRVAVREFLESRGRRAGNAAIVRSRPGRGRRQAAKLRLLAKDPRYRNRFVALFQDRVLDSDEDLRNLVLRVLNRGEHPVYIERVTESGEPPRIRFRGVRASSP